MLPSNASGACSVFYLTRELGYSAGGVTRGGGAIGVVVLQRGWCWSAGGALGMLLVTCNVMRSLVRLQLLVVAECSVCQVSLKASNLK